MQASAVMCLFSSGGRLQQCQLTGRTDVSDVQAGTGLAGQPHGQFRGAVAGFRTAYFGVVADVRIVAIECLATFDVFGDDRLVLAMGGDEDAGFREDGTQGIHAVDKHIAGAGTHEQLHAADARLVQVFKQRGIGVCCAEIE